MNEITSAVSAARTTRSVMYVNTLNARTYCSRYWASSSSMVASRSGCWRERVGDALHAHEARALHQQRGAGLGLAPRGLEDPGDVVEVARALAERRHGGRAVGPKREERVDAVLARIGTDLGVQHRGFRAELAHVAHHEHASPRLCREHPQGRLHRLGIRVVAVVDHAGARGAGPLLQPP